MSLKLGVALAPGVSSPPVATGVLLAELGVALATGVLLGAGASKPPAQTSPEDTIAMLESSVWPEAAGPGTCVHELPSYRIMNMPCGEGFVPLTGSQHRPTPSTDTQLSASPTAQPSFEENI